MAACCLSPLEYVKEAAKCIFTEALLPPVKRHIDYWWCFDGNVQGLRDEIGGLEMEWRNRNQEIEEARLRAEIATTDVKNWSNKGTQKLEDLALLSFGLGMFEGIDNIEDGRNRTYNLLERLRSRFLLLMTDRDEELCVKMHDVVRDVAIFIGSKDKKRFLKSLEVSSNHSSRYCNWMSVDISISNAKLPVGLDFPNLRLLMILNSSYSEGFDVSDICFKGMEELTVLYFSNQKFKSLPSSLKFLKKLRKLHLDNCEVKDISIVGELTSLEILRILRCTNIEELPANVRELKSLRLLELRDCYKLERIVGGVISSLVGLEELKIVFCFNKWEAKGNLSEERNASLSEL